MSQAAESSTTDAPLVELTPIPDTFACELARMEHMGPVTRLIFAATHSVDYA